MCACVPQGCLEVREGHWIPLGSVMSDMWVLGLEPDLGEQLSLFSGERLVPTLVCGDRHRSAAGKRMVISVWPLGLEVLVLVSRSILALAVTV